MASFSRSSRPRETSIATLLAGFVAAATAAGCGNGTPGGTPATGGSGAEQVTDPGVTVQVAPSQAQSAEATRVERALADVSGFGAADVAERYPTAFVASPGYDTGSVVGLDRIQGSSSKLSDAELAQLGKDGFVISQAHPYPSFAYGYSTFYLEHLPVYVSADSIMNAVHKSYDGILKQLELNVLNSELDQLLSGMHRSLASGGGGEVDAKAAADADVFLAVARSLLSGNVVKPVAGGSASQVQRLFDLAEAASGTATVSLFGVMRQDEDFSQFKPRGHYADTPQLSNYFRAMIWLGRIDLRLLETQADGTQLFRRRQLEITLLFRALIDSKLRPHFDRIDRTIAAFVGEPDYMVLSQVDELMSDLGISSAAELSGFSDEQLAQAIIDGDYGAQRISSHIMVNGGNVRTLPLSRSFALLGQRYALDSHVFSNVVYDRVNGGGKKRMLPNPLDAAFAALQNDQAGALLAPELTEYEETGYPAALAKTRVLADDHPSDFWNGSLYTLWLDALRNLSPSVTSTGADADTLFPVARTEAWGRRLLSTQLASWAEVRHDTILYVKQSYTGGATCNYPDAYVDPYPEFFAALSAYGARGSALLDALDLGSGADSIIGSVRDHFAQVSLVSDMLGSIAKNERSGADLTPDMLAFINDAVVVENLCGGGYVSAGWYKRLFWNSSTALESAPTIADVHTQPTDEGGNPVGHVLHVGTGSPRLMVVIADGCSGPHAYAGLASAYREKVTDDFERLDDQTWENSYYKEPEVPWMRDLVQPGDGTPTASPDGI